MFQIFTAFDTEFFIGIVKMMFDGVHRNAKMFGNFIGAPVACSEHTDGEFGGTEVVGDVVTGFRIVDATPTGGEAIGDIDDALEIVGPLGFDDGFKRAAEKAMMLTEGFDEVVWLGKAPGGEEMFLSKGGVFETDGVHDGDKMKIDGRNGIIILVDGKSCFDKAEASGVIAFEIGAVRLHIKGELAQTGRQHVHRAAQVRQLFRQWQMQQDTGSGDNKDSGSTKVIRGIVVKLSKNALNSIQACAGTMHLAEGEIGVGEDQAGRQAQCWLCFVEIGFTEESGSFGVAAEIIQLGTGDVALTRILKGFHHLGQRSRG